MGLTRVGARRLTIVGAMRLTLVGAIGLTCVSASAQAPEAMRFEVASVKPSRSATPEVKFGLEPGGRFTATNVPAWELIRSAYGVSHFAPEPSPNTPNPLPAQADAPSIFTAVQEQLGLKLESTKAPVDVLVVDRIERRTGD